RGAKPATRPGPFGPHGGERQKTNKNQKPRPRSEVSGSGGLPAPLLGGAGVARVLAGDPRLTLDGVRRQRALPRTQALQGLWCVGEAGSMAATRTLTLAFDGSPSSTNLGCVQAIGAERVAGFAGSVACCTRNPCRAGPLSHFETTSPVTLPGLTVRPTGAPR